MTDLPDVCTEFQGDSVVVVANTRARKLLNRHFDKPRPKWGAIVKGSGCFSSPEYRAIQLEGNCQGVLAAMLWTVHDVGMSAMFRCAECNKLHVVDDEQAGRFLFAMMSDSEQALPAHRTIQ